MHFDTFIFYMQKTLLFIVLPPSGNLLLILSGVILLRSKYKREGKILVASAIILLYLFSIELVATPLIRGLENDYPPLDSRVQADALIVLTGGAMDLTHIGRGIHPSRSSITRLTHALAIHETMQDITLIVSGGRGDPVNRSVSEGEALGWLARQLGMAEEHLVIEDASINTYQSSLEVKRMIPRLETIILVTSAYHMARAVSFFERSGFTVFPAPTDFRGGRMHISLFLFVPRATHLKNSSTALYEYANRVRYTLLPP